jgi:hypothetical protein
VPRVFRLNPGARRLDGWTAANVQEIRGPYLSDWQYSTGKRAADLDRLLCARPARADAGATRRYRPGYLCDTWTPFARQTVAVGELARDLARELGAVLAFGCAQACSPPLESAREVAQSFVSPGPLRLSAVRGQFDLGDPDEPIWPQSIGWVARLANGNAEVEVACARHQDFDSLGKAPSNQCRITVLNRHRPVASYYPSWYQHVELPDRGALHLQAAVDDPRADLGNDVLVLGSALAAPAAGTAVRAP